MKKLTIAVTLLAIALLLCCSVVAFAADSEQIISKIVALEGVEDAKVAICNNTCFVAIKPRGIVSKSQAMQLRQRVVEAVQQEDASLQVAVSFSVKLFCQIERLEKLPEAERQVEIDKLMDRLSKIPMPLNCQ